MSPGQLGHPTMFLTMALVYFSMAAHLHWNQGHRRVNKGHCSLSRFPSLPQIHDSSAWGSYDKQPCCHAVWQPYALSGKPYLLANATYSCRSFHWRFNSWLAIISFPNTRVIPSPARPLLLQHSPPRYSQLSHLFNVHILYEWLQSFIVAGLRNFFPPGASVLQV